MPREQAGTFHADPCAGFWITICTGAQEHRGGISGRPCHDIRHPMHAVNEINIEDARRPEHHLRARRHAPPRVRCKVARAVVRFDLGDHELEPLPCAARNARADVMDEPFAEQVARDGDGRPVEK